MYSILNMLSHMFQHIILLPVRASCPMALQSLCFQHIILPTGSPSRLWALHYLYLHNFQHCSANRLLSCLIAPYSLSFYTRFSTLFLLTCCLAFYQLFTFSPFIQISALSCLLVVPDVWQLYTVCFISSHRLTNQTALHLMWCMTNPQPFFLIAGCLG